jgi:hypothetical protein
MLALFGFQPAHASIECVGKPGPVLLYKNGLVAAAFAWNTGDSGFYHICNTSGEFSGISSEVCLAWYATLMKAKSQQQLNVALYFDTSSTCASVPPAESTPTVHYLGIYSMDPPPTDPPTPAQ